MKLADKEHGVLFFLNIPAVMGGAETLVLRAMRWAVDNAYPCFTSGVVFAGVAPDQMLLDAIDGLGVPRNTLFLQRNQTIFDCREQLGALKLEGIKRLTIITPSSRELFLVGEEMKRRYPQVEIDNLYYVVHHHAFTVYAQNTADRIARPFLAPLYNWVLKKIMSNRALVSQDEQCLEEMQKIHKKLDMKSVPIIRLPYNVKPLNISMASERYAKKEKWVVTCARMAFPHKSYLLGLVNEFASVAKKHPEMRLLMIGDGPDKPQVLGKIAELEKDIADKIETIDAVPYEQLDAYLQKAYVYVGMGTTLMDASNSTVPALVAYAYQELGQCRVNGYFAENWSNIGFTEDNSQPASVFLAQVAAYSEDEYIERAAACHQALQQHYSTENTMRCFMGCQTKERTPVFTNGQIARYAMVEKMKTIIKNR